MSTLHLSSPELSIPRSLTLEQHPAYRENSQDLQLHIASKEVPSYETKLSKWAFAWGIAVLFAVVMFGVFLVDDNVTALALAVGVSVVVFRAMLDPRGASTRLLREGTETRMAQTIQVVAGVVHAGALRFPLREVRVVQKIDPQGDRGVWVQTSDGSYPLAEQLEHDEAEFVVRLLTE